MATPSRVRANGFLLSVTPPLRTVTPGAIVSYQVGLEETSWTDPDNAWSVQWIATNDNDRIREDEWWPFHRPFFVRKFGSLWPEFEWTTPGRYTIQARVWEKLTGRETLLIYRQWVEEAETVLAAELDRIEGDQIADPWVVWSKKKQELDTILAIEKSHGVPPGKEAQHAKDVKLLEDFTNGLKDVIDRTYSCLETVPVKVVHIAKATQQKSRLNVYLARVGLRGHTWRLVDWTNPIPTARTFKTEFEATGTGATPEEADRAAILDLISQWDDANEYWPGALSYEIRSGIWGDPIEGSFETDGESFWSMISRWLDWIALGTAVVAAVATLVLPVPGSRVVSALIWTSIFSSTAAAVINIGERHDGGYGSWQDDAFDALTIVGNMFVGVGGALKWAKGAKFANIKALATAETVALWGDIGTAGIEGVVVTVQGLKDLEKIDLDPGLSPSERLHQWLAAMARILGTAAMTVVSIRSTKADLDNLNRSPSHVHADDTKAPVEKLEDAKDTSKEIEMPEHPRTEGHTDDGGQTTRVQEENARVHARDGYVPPRRNWPSPPPARKRGLLPKHDEVFAEFASENKRWILVRDGNTDSLEYLGKPGYAGKPETLKVKTNTVDSSPHKGLVCFDPSHSRTLTTLAEMDPKTTVIELRSNPAEQTRRWNAYKDHLESTGYKVEDAAGGYRVYSENVTTGEKTYYHGDTDLHGVYDEVPPGSGVGKYRQATKDIQDELNGKLGNDMIQHGAHDDWPDRNKPKAKENRGPQPPVTVFGPDGSKVYLETKEELKTFYLDHKFGWKERYGDYEDAVGEIGTL